VTTGSGIRKIRENLAAHKCLDHNSNFEKEKAGSEFPASINQEAQYGGDIVKLAAATSRE